MTDYLNPAGIYPDGIKPMEYKSARIVEPVNQCVSCGAEMSEGNMVCPACVESWTIKADEHAITVTQGTWAVPNNFVPGDGWLDLSKDPTVLYKFDGEKWINCNELMEKATTQESLQVEEKVRKSAEIICEGADKINRLMNLKIWLIEQIEKETDETRLKTLRGMLEGVEV
jgi:hypothetical protein